jgi:hypothetical protein
MRYGIINNCHSILIISLNINMAVFLLEWNEIKNTIQF